MIVVVHSTEIHTNEAGATGKNLKIRNFVI